jgi:cyclin-dependent kinase 8/11
MNRSVFEGSSITYPSRRVTHEDNGDAKMGSYVVFLFLMMYILIHRLPPSLAAPRLPSSSNFRPPSAINAPVKRTKLR